MHVKKLMAILSQVPNAENVTVKGIAEPIISCHIPTGAIPNGWHLTNESMASRIEGMMRIRYGFQKDWKQIYPE